MKTMKKPDMPSQDAFRALYPPQDESYMRAVRSTLASLESEREVKPKVKKKVSFAVAFAAALALALACTAVAAGMGVFGKIAERWSAWGGDAYMNALDEESAVVGQTRSVSGEGVCPEVFHLDGSGISQVVGDADNHADKVMEAAAICPVNAIEV